MIKKIDLSYCILFSIINFFFISIFLYFSPFDIECDAALFFKSGKFFYDFLFSKNYELILNYRPPVFPLYLLFTGTFFFNSLYPYVIVNALLSFFAPLLIYFSLNFYGRHRAFIFTLLFLFSTVLYINLKSGLELHLLIFFIILNICSLINFYNKKKITYLYLTVLSSLLALFIRFDVIFLLFFDLVFLIFFFIKNKNLLKHILISYFIVFLISLLWMLLKFIVLYLFFYNSANINNYKNNKFNLFYSSITSLNHQTGSQLYWRINNDIRGSINIKNNNQSYIYNFLDANNGPESLKLFKQFEITLLKKETWKKIKFFKDKMHPLSETDKRSRHKIFYEDYWRFKNNPKLLAKNIFNKDYESLYYSMQLPVLLMSDIGPIETDRLFLKAMIETINKNAAIKKKFLSEIFYLYLENVKSDYNWYNLEGSKNIGGCAFAGLSKSMYSEYSISYDKNSYLNNITSSKIKNIVSNLKNYIRNVTSILFVFFIFFFIKSQNKTLIVFLFLKFFFTVAIIAIFAGIINSKYETYTSIIMYFILFYLSLPVVNYINKIFLKKNYKL